MKMLRDAILEQLDRLDERQQQQVLDFITALLEEVGTPEALDWASLDQPDDDEEGMVADEW